MVHIVVVIMASVGFVDKSKSTQVKTRWFQDPRSLNLVDVDFLTCSGQVMAFMSPLSHHPTMYDFLRVQKMTKDIKEYAALELDDDEYFLGVMVRPSKNQQLDEANFMSVMKFEKEKDGWYESCCICSGPVNVYGGKHVDERKGRACEFQKVNKLMDNLAQVENFPEGHTNVKGPLFQ